MVIVTATDSAWQANQLSLLQSEDELEIVVDRPDREPQRVPVWMVVVDGELYVRSYMGVTSGWFRRVEADADQAVRIGSTDVAVRFENIDRTDSVNHAISAEYDRKYSRFDYVTAMSEPAAVEATLRVTPIIE